MLKNTLNTLALPLIFLAAFFSTAAAAGALAPDDGFNLWAPVWEAFRHGDYVYAGALALVATVAVARLYGTDYIAWVGTDQGGAALALFGSLGATLAVSLSDGSGLTWGILSRAALIAVSAAGGYSMIKRLLITPYLVPVVNKHPKLAGVLRVVLIIFNIPEPISSEPTLNPPTESDPNV
jgi:hypothetical protein